MDIFQSLLNFLLKPNCPLCERPTPQSLCIYCHRQLLETRLLQPIQPPGNLVAWGHYHGALKRAIAACKYQNHPELAMLFGELLGNAWLQCYPSHPQRQQLRVIPIPLHPDKQRQRGFNQAALIARSFCQRTRLRLDGSLQRPKLTQAQFQLTPLDRQRNLQDAFRLIPGHKLTGRSVLLIDDIYTTGATMASASQLLQAAGVRVAGVAVVAIAGLSYPNSQARDGQQ
jgi:ComF family protein